MHRFHVLLAAVAFSAAAASLRAQVPAELAWPAPTAENRLATRWWWIGNAVDEKNLTRQLEAFRQAGLGGVEICPIYGAFGAENRYIDFLSPAWMAMLAHTTREGKRLGLNVDMTTGTGWPFGGSMVPDADASKGLTLKTFDHLPKREEFPAGRLVAAAVVTADGRTVPLEVASFETGAWFDSPPAGTFVLGFQTGPQQKVKRPAPNAEGNVLDPYSLASLNNYLGVFDKAFTGFTAPMPRTQFHDSFEYYDATWTPDFFEEFRKRRGYDLHAQLGALAGVGDAQTVARVKCDYRETLSDLHLAYMNRWVEWSRSHGMLGRNQAHGGPGNILDVYANADIPECEVFHLYDESQLPFLKLASSAAHVTGKTLTSCETFTWLDEHFSASLGEVKSEADFVFLAGVNHMFLHGVPYSPEDAAWPGWQFYASVNFGPTGGLWRDLPAFTAYVARVQSILQANKAGNDVLLYVPWHEFWSDPANNGRMMVQFTTPGTWMKPYAYYDLALALQNAGVQYDEVSDAQLEKAAAKGDRMISLGGNTYRMIIVPRTPVLPVATMQRLKALAGQGATIVFEDRAPSDVPGFGEQAARRAQLAAAASALNAPAHPLEWFKTSLPGEPMYASGLRCVRRARLDGYDYFVVNRSEKAVDRVPLGVQASAALVMDPRYENRIGAASIISSPVTRGAATAPRTELALHVEPGESFVIRTYTHALAGTVPGWNNWAPAGAAIPLAGAWAVSFIEGGPVAPRPLSVKTDAAGKLPSWTDASDDPEARRFAGTAKYTLRFSKPAGNVADYRLALGKVGDSARVALNGKPLGTLWAEPYTITLGDALKAGENTLEIEVTNVAANRIRDMDQRGVQWKIFRDANVLSTGYTAFDASGWPVRPAGLMGPVTLTPVQAEK